MSSSAADNDDDGMHLFKVHGRAISTLAWNGSGTALFLCSYNSSVRLLDVERGHAFEEVFAAYGNDERYRDRLGYGTDRGYKSWVQGMEIDGG